MTSDEHVPQDNHEGGGAGLQLPRVFVPVLSPGHFLTCTQDFLERVTPCQSALVTFGHSKGEETLSFWRGWRYSRTRYLSLSFQFFLRQAR